jgi:hypothetical protein
MTPKDRLYWFWATGILPGTIFDGLDEAKSDRIRTTTHTRRRRSNRRRANGTQQ